MQGVGQMVWCFWRDSLLGECDCSDVNVCTDGMAHMEESNETDVEDEAFSLSAFVVWIIHVLYGFAKKTVMQGSHWHGVAQRICCCHAGHLLLSDQINRHVAGLAWCGSIGLPNIIEPQGVAAVLLVDKLRTLAEIPFWVRSSRHIGSGKGGMFDHVWANVVYIRNRGRTTLCFCVCKHRCRNSHTNQAKNPFGKVKTFVQHLASVSSIFGFTTTICSQNNIGLQHGCIGNSAKSRPSISSKSGFLVQRNTIENTM